MAIIPDPFTQLYDAVYNALTAHTPFTDLVRLRNQIRYDQADRSPLRGSVMKADTPEVALLTAGGTFELTMSSTSAEAIQNLTIKNITGDQRVQKILYPLKWETARALRKAGGTLGLDFVNNVRLTEHTEELDDFDQSRGQQGWVSEIIIEATLIIPRSELET